MKGSQNDGWTLVRNLWSPFSNFILNPSAGWTDAKCKGILPLMRFTFDDVIFVWSLQKLHTFWKFRRTSQFVLGSTKLCTRPANQHFGSHLDCDPFPSSDYLAMGRHLAAIPLRVFSGPELGATGILEKFCFIFFENKNQRIGCPNCLWKELTQKIYCSLIPGEKHINLVAFEALCSDGSFEDL